MTTPRGPQQSLSAALTRVTWTTTAMALLVSALALLAYDLVNQRQQGLQDLRSQAALVASSAVAALAFDDPQALQETLLALRERQRVRLVSVYRADGTLFNGVAAPGERLPDRLSDDGSSDARQGIDSVGLVLPVVHVGERLGSVYLVSRLGLTQRLRDTGLILVAIGGAGFLIAAAVFGRLRRRLLRPLSNVADAADEVARQRDFGLRAPTSGLAEVDVLVRAFNDMLGTLQQEIQDRQRAEAALKEDDRRKDEFLATLAHELRNPLAPIRHAAGVFSNDRASEAQRLRSAAIIERQVRHMALLLDDLLDVSRITRGKLALRRGPHALAEIVASAVETSRPLIEARRHQLSVAVPQPSPVVDADPLRLAQVLSNLLSNAAKFTEPGGVIRLSAEARADGVRLRVEDNGMGIARQSLPLIFSMFGQGPGGERGGGLGIGLALSRALVELHGGQLTAHSDGEGHGTSMVVHLPPAVGAPPVAEPVPVAVATAAAAPAAPARLRVLVADDNRDAADTLHELLTLDGHQVQVAYDGEEALAAWQGFSPQVALLDIGMPKATGDEVARRIRAAGDRAVLLVALSGWGQERDKAAALAAGFDEHLTKPVDAARLAALLQTRRPQEPRPSAGA
ncbi:ATP-binding protein [Aquabacterium sp. J223]|uniref:ATP-binding protein n=1 Tax=Aquabacterium sp. J223 TaxID=2898431 RepID=UPI0021ADA66C|nr:ATP-binding protein [Aquabacterium sp. J223]UUX94439.1 ATP-binding protein [Aquabacterium sp. J223]